MESALRPRDIQARIRAGETAEEVAQAAQTTVESVMRFASPVFAERAHVAQQALKASVRRRPQEPGSARTLGEASEIYFSEHGLHDEDVEWDAWRRADGRWALVAAYAVDGRPCTAEFTHDLPGRYVVADNDEAKYLIGEQRRPEPRDPGERRGRRLSAVPHDQDELPLGDDALELVRDPAPAPASTETPGTPEAPEAPAPEAPASERDLGAPAGPAAAPPTPQAGDDLPTVTADADWMTDAPAVPSARSTPPQEPEQATAPAPERPEPAAEEPEPAQEQAEPEPEPAPEPAPTSKRRRRSSVPSWDEIMFGGGSGGSGKE